MADCMACDLTAGRLPLPGGIIHRTRLWVVEHCIGALGAGTLIVKPERHLLTPAQKAEWGAVGPELQMVMLTAGDVPDPDTVERLAAQARSAFAASTF